MEIGKCIAQYRKQSGLKQEELAKRIGVSPQAVSKWENGGAPDVALLPDIARELGVSVDALFGIEGPMENWRKYALEEFQQLDTEQQMKEICEFLWAVQKGIDMQTTDFAKGLGYLDDETEERYDPKRLVHTAVVSDGGILLGNAMKSFQYSLVMPQPTRGFKSVLMSPEEYQKLFQVLGKPGHMEVLIWIYGQMRLAETRVISAETIVRKAKLSEKVVKESLADLCQLKLLMSIEMEDEERIRTLYYVNISGSLLPALYFWREALQENSSTVMHICNRSYPLLD